MIKLIALLGNYGKQYSGTRHNAAWIFAESLSIFFFDAEFITYLNSGVYTKIKLGGQKKRRV